MPWLALLYLRVVHLKMLVLLCTRYLPSKLHRMFLPFSFTSLFISIFNDSSGASSVSSRVKIIIGVIVALVLVAVAVTLGVVLGGGASRTTSSPVALGQSSSIARRFSRSRSKIGDHVCSPSKVY